VWLGRLSYGIYLWHWPVIQLGRPRLDALPHALQDVVLLTIAVALAVVSFHLVEHPIRRQPAGPPGRRAAWATLAAAAVATTRSSPRRQGRGHVAAFDPGSIGDIQPVSAPVTTTTPPASHLTQRRRQRPRDRRLCRHRSADTCRWVARAVSGGSHALDDADLAPPVVGLRRQRDRCRSPRRRRPPHRASV
jgi:hypothetical protein